MCQQAEAIRPPGEAPKTFAAFSLGFCARYVGTDVVEDCLLILADEISPNIYQSLFSALQHVNQAAEEVSKEIDQQRRQAAEPDPVKEHQYVVRHLDIESDQLRAAADQAVPDGTELRTWYELGAALGDYYRHEQNLPTAAKTDDEARVRAAIRGLPNSAEAIEALQVFTQIERTRVPFPQLLNGVIAELSGPKADPWLANESNSPVVRFAIAIGEGLRNCMSPQTCDAAKPPQPPSTQAKTAHSRQPVAETERVQLYGPGEPPKIDGKTKTVLTAAEYAVVKSLICAKHAGDRITIQNWPGKVEDVEHPRKTFDNLRKKDPDWANVLLASGQQRLGYRIQ